MILCGLSEKGISALHKIFKIVRGCGTPIFDTEHRNFLKNNNFTKKDKHIFVENIKEKLDNDNT